MLRLYEDRPILQTGTTIDLMPREAVPLAKVQLVQGVRVIQQIRVGAEAEGEGSQGRKRKAIFLGGAVAEESGDDGHAAADYAGAHFGSIVRCWREQDRFWP